MANLCAGSSAQVREDPGHGMSQSYSEGSSMSMLPNSCLCPLFILYLYFHDGKDVTREIPGDGDGDAQQEVTIELDWDLSLSVFKGVTEYLALI